MPSPDTAYTPPADGQPWREVAPEAAGLEPNRLAAAVRVAAEAETPWPVDLEAKIRGGFFEPPPFNEILGPCAPRGAPNGLLLKGGAVVARWGDTRRVDMTFSVAKSYLSLLTGIALGDRLIADLDEPVGARVRDGGFEGRNAGVTWRHLLTQTSEWEGVLFGKSDEIDRNRVLGIDNTGRPPRPTHRDLKAPGAFWEYNDVRVNRLALSLLRVFRQPLPEVFAERLMYPIGASETWRWEGYRNASVEVDGRPMLSVPGGGHWGGGVFIHAEDQARIGLLAARDGVWGGRRLLPEGWMAASRQPCPLEPGYGFLWWLNTGRTKYPSASPESFFALGTGGNLTWIDPANDLVGVLRWTDPARADDVIGGVMEAQRAAA
ncbi:serine hydrolase [Enterovirga sp.]|jgi:CubicO group peptidase (beta-lactamase class C family)|uniref:serine hydrolase domain-containing protein n=1 Tax=Enterovirga sp. TaxID=2026350 RepID=UPI00260CC68F|nr:serine hydrolase [Enterovirga sp.]MDB5591545.1 serine hydrolase [Enterovirga sp.]